MKASWHQAYDAMFPANISFEISDGSVQTPEIARKVVFLLMFAVLMLPMWFMIVGSLQNIKGLMAMPPRWLPLTPSVQSYTLLFRVALPGWAYNTLIATASTVVLAVTVSCCTGYAFAFFNFKGKRALWAMIMLAMMLPRMSILLSLYVVVKDLGIPGTLMAVIFPLALYPVGMYLARTYFESVPRSLLESARIDGASEVSILFRVVMPISRPIVAAIAVFAAINVLGDYIWQMLVLQRPARQTLIVGLIRSIMTRGPLDTSINPIGKGLAAGVVLTIPLLVVFVLGNRYFVGALGGAVKE